MHTVFDFQAHAIDGRPVALMEYHDRVLLIVNTASRCGFTPQLAALEQLWERYRTRGLVVLGFPCNQFGRQEPGSAQEIGDFCSTRYGVTFPLMEKVEVNGAHAHPLWQWLTAQAPGLLGTRAVKWNFTKFLVGRDGQAVRRYAPGVPPDRLQADIERALQ